jgi:hypothetical protein
MAFLGAMPFHNTELGPPVTDAPDPCGLASRYRVSPARYWLVRRAHGLITQFSPSRV